MPESLPRPAGSDLTNRETEGITWLFVPGDRPDRFRKAVDSGADQVILDLEDAVAPGAKDRARDHVSRQLSTGVKCWVRVNASSSELWQQDLSALVGKPGVAGVMVPKCETPDGLAEAHRILGSSTPLIALVETARGVSAVNDIARCPNVARLAFGSVDFALDIDAEHDDLSLLTARSLIVLASRAAGIPSPLDGVTLDIENPELCRQDATRGRRLGFGGKLCVHPAQVPIVKAVFEPSAEQLAWARGVVVATESGVATFEGQMVDEPVLKRARRILRQLNQDDPAPRK